MPTSKHRVAALRTEGALAAVLAEQLRSALLFLFNLSKGTTHTRGNPFALAIPST